MKKTSLLVGFACLACAFFIVWLKWSHGQGLGHNVWIALSALGIVFTFCCLSLLTIGTVFQRTFTGLWIAIFSFTFSYVAADLSLGALLIRPISPPSVPDSIVHHRFTPNTVTQVQSPVEPVSAMVRVNNLGLRGKDIQTSKPEGAFRIILLGDSFTLGAAVSEHETFASRLQHLFNAHGEEAVEIINAGINSYSPILSYLQLKNSLTVLAPDLVVLNLDMSDLMQEHAYRTLSSQSDSGEIIAVSGMNETKEISTIRKFERWMVNHLYISRLLYYWTTRLFGSSSAASVESRVTMADPSLLDHTLENDTIDREKHWDDIFESIGEIQALALHHNFQFLLTTYPWGHQLGPHEWSKGRALFLAPSITVSKKSLHEIQHRANRAGIQFFSLFPALENYQGSKHLYFDYDMHWTPEGHSVVAQALFAELTKHYIVLPEQAS